MVQMRCSVARTGRRLRKGLTAIALCSLVSCEECCTGDLCDWPPVEQPTLTRIAVVPDVVWATPGSSFVLHLRAWDSNGDPAPLPASGLAWSGNAGVTVSAQPGGKALVSIDPTNAQTTVAVSAAVGGLNATAAIRLAGPPEDDRLRVPASTSPQPPRAVWMQVRESACDHDLLLSVVEGAHLGANLGPACDPTRVGVLSKDRGSWVEAGPPTGVTVPPWTLGVDVLARSALPAVRPVSLALVLRAHGVTQADAYDELAVASAAFAEGRTGITFDVVSTTTGNAGTLFLLSYCDDAGVLSSFGVDLAKPYLHVLYVDKIGAGFRGHTCRRKATAGALVVVAADAAPTTLAHELGHAMGLYAPLPWWGHITTGSADLFGFDLTNLMYVGESVESPSSRGSISVGQAFRMNVVPESWLVHELGLTPWSCPCDPYDHGLCPALYRDPTVTGLPSSVPPSCTTVPP